MLALEKSLEGYDSGKFPLGIIYHSEGGQSFEENLSVVLDDAVRSSRPVITVRPYGLENVPLNLRIGVTRSLAGTPTVLQMQ